MTATDIKNGLTIEYNGNIYQVLWFQHHKPGKGAAMVNAKLKNLRTGAITDQRFNPDEKIQTAQIDKVVAQFIYKEGHTFNFMNMETYETIEIDESKLQEEQKYLFETLEVSLMFFNGSEILGVILPEKIVLTVEDTEPGVKGDTKTSATKDAVTNTGLLVKVPLFIEKGEKIIVSTYDGSYVSRDK